MALDAELLEILICPACQGGVRELEQEQGLECGGCGRIYPVRDGIPVMLVEEASEPTPGAQKD
ncbi:MAG: Trm112 family protein [Acidobacteria bacterium]|nr:Trm112 family protein [Acidobacteriota bacterium]NIM61126.1 Trm112 family protein [Acidobacteriota bacterium]NIO58716.1 Trm112 family protein [Acidobacteriota bacterium]NIQ29767.1 Trm112 family protein [Acidobacteriota bacterium]NIQ84487.1 Trm112 family protein [Acidobacteriota bacterium]